MSDLLKAACIGLRHGHALGLIGTFQQLEGVQVVAYCEDTEAAARGRLRESQPAARYYSDVDELLAREEFDLACVALPASEVPGVGIRLAQAGKHFFVEKQFARTVAELRPLVQAVRERDAPFGDYGERPRPDA